MVYLFLAEGFEEIEALAPADMLRRADIAVTIAGVGSKIITGSHGISVLCDCEAKELTPDENVEALILPGGMPGMLNLEASPIVQSFIDYADANGKLICAICAAPAILAHKGLLKNKNATCFPTFEKELDGAVISDEHIVSDANIITAKGAGVSVDFGLEIVARIAGKEKAQNIRESIQCKKEY